jgi:Peptidase family M28
MRRLSLIAVLSLPIACAAGPRPTAQFDGDVAMSYVKTQMGFGPRIPNTEGHRLAGDWIQERLRSTADTVEVQAFTHVSVDRDTLHLQNFIGRFRPAATDRILYVTHWDTRPMADKSTIMAQRRLPVPGANDGASGVAVLLGVADELRRTPPAFGVDLLFVDGEDYGDFGLDQDVLLGSRYFAANLPADYHPLYGVVFDMVGDRDLVLYKEWNSVDGAPEVVERIWRRAEEMGYRRVFVSEVGITVTDDHIPLQKAGIRTVDLIHLPSYHHTTDDTIDKISAKSLKIVGSVAVSLVR